MTAPFLFPPPLNLRKMEAEAAEQAKLAASGQVQPSHPSEKEVGSALPCTVAPFEAEAEQPALHPLAALLSVYCLLQWYKLKQFLECRT